MIVVIGEALIDLIEDKTAKGRYQAVVGGANANVAIALARAGVKQQLLARISSDAFGQVIRQRLVDNKVGLDYAINASEPTSLAIASIGDSGGASYAFYVENTADWNWTNEELPTLNEMASMGASAIQFGCLTMAMEPGSRVIESWAREFFERDLLTISHDINVRPALGFDASKERARVERLNSISHLVKASDDDINWLFDLEAKSNVDQIVRGWIGESSKIVFVTRGDEGVSVYRKNGARLDISSRKVSVQDTVGAGDTFCATVLSQLQNLGSLGSSPFEKLELLSDQQLIEIAEVASIAASMACEKTGAEPPTTDELSERLKLIREN